MKTMVKSKFTVELCNRFAVLEFEENVNKDCIQMEKSLHRNCPKSIRSSEKEKQAMAEGRNLESNRPAVTHDKIHMKFERQKSKLWLIQNERQRG